MTFLQKKNGLTPFHKGLIIGGVGVAAVAGIVNAVGKNTSVPVGINEVREMGTVERTITGSVTREAVEPSGKERYVISTEGTKYVLIGLKQSYGVAEKENEGKNSPKPKASAALKPRLDKTKVDQEDINSFEEYVGKTVTITGFVVPVEKKPSMSPKGQVENNGKKPSPKASMKPSPSPKDSGWDYSRFVVKSVVVAK